MKDRHVRWEQFLDGDLSAASQLGSTDGEARSFRMLFMAMPWERCRSRRLLCHGTRHDLGWVQGWETTPAPAGWSRYEDWKAISRWVPSTLLGWNWGQWEFSNRPKHRALERHAARIRIALADWRREHGSLPESLDALVGPYFEKLPLDPLTRRPFVYYPRGLPYDVAESGPTAAPYVLLATGTPFLWTSRGHSILMAQFTRTAQGRTVAADALTRGKHFPIPPPSE